MVDYPVILDLPGPRIRGYSRESLIAEKLESIARFGMLNSRLKDFYDIWLLASRQEFRGEILLSAIAATFSNRNRDLDVGVIEVITEFGQDRTRASQWEEFCKKNDLVPNPPNLLETTGLIIKLLQPVVATAPSGEVIKSIWPAGGPWGE